MRSQKEKTMTMIPQQLADLLYVGSGATQMHAILACAMGRDPLTTARFVGKATVTSDGYIQCDFVDHDGTGRRSAFVGSYGELEANLQSLVIQHLGLGQDELQQATTLIESWIGTDYR
jgi:hypothetical protein